MQFQVSLTTREALVGLVSLIAAGLVLTLAYLVDYAAGQRSEAIAGFLNLDGEANIPAWFSSAQLLLAGVVLALLVKSTVPLPVSRRFVLLVAAGLVGLSLDETAYIHEQLTIVTFRFESLPTFEDGQGPWIAMYAAALAAIAYLLRSEIATAYRTYRSESQLVIVAVAFFALAVALEIASYEFLRTPGHETMYTFEVAAEEYAEMIGGSLLLFGCVRYAIAAHRAAGLVPVEAGPGLSPEPSPSPAGGEASVQPAEA